VVRFPALWASDRAGIRQAVLPGIRSADRGAAGVPIYAVGFVARPIGAAIFGHYGDSIGRKAALIATLLLTGLATFAVGFVPTYEQIGIWGASS
jgi:MFS family permease